MPKCSEGIQALGSWMLNSLLVIKAVVLYSQRFSVWSSFSSVCMCYVSNYRENGHYFLKIIYLCDDIPC